jgi:hypothetical protein
MNLQRKVKRKRYDDVCNIRSDYGTLQSMVFKAMQPSAQYILPWSAFEAAPPVSLKFGWMEVACWLGAFLLVDSG